MLHGNSEFLFWKVENLLNWKTFIFCSSHFNWLLNGTQTLYGFIFQFIFSPVSRFHFTLKLSGRAYTATRKLYWRRKWSNKNLLSSRSDGKNCQFLSPFWQSKAALRSRAQAFDMFFPHFLDTILNVFPPFSLTPEIHCVCLCVPYRQIKKH